MLQVPQPGAQNQKPKGPLALAFANENVPPPTSGDVHGSVASATGAVVSLPAGVVEPATVSTADPTAASPVGSAPQADSNAAPATTTAIIRRRIEGVAVNMPSP